MAKPSALPPPVSINYSPPSGYADVADFYTGTGAFTLVVGTQSEPAQFFCIIDEDVVVAWPIDLPPYTIRAFKVPPRAQAVVFSIGGVPFYVAGSNI